jgi:plasmid maintenance system antidote protein VapI
MSTPHQKFRRWIAYETERGRSKLDLAVDLGCHPSTISHLIAGRRTPGLALAFAIDRATKRARTGHIRAETWADVDLRGAVTSRRTGTEG